MTAKFIDSFASCSWAFSQLRHDVYSLNIGTAAAAGNECILPTYTQPIWTREFCDASPFVVDSFT